MIPNPTLDGPALKIRRAKEHIEDLNAKLGSYFTSGSYRFVAEDNGKTNQRTIGSKIDQPIPEIFSPILGDAVHNLRATLDLLYWDLFSSYTKAERLDNLRFPFHGDINNFKGAVRSAGVEDSAPKDLVRALYDMEPYPGGKGESLHSLHKLDIADKHKLIIPVASKLLFYRINLRDIDPSFPFPLTMDHTSVEALELGQGLACWIKNASSPPLAVVQERLDQETKNNFAGAILFSANLPFAGQVVIPTLKGLTSDVEAAVATLRAAAV